MKQTNVVTRLLIAAVLFFAGARTSSAAIAIDATTFKDLASASTTITTPTFSTTSGNELLLAFVSTDRTGSGANVQVNSMSGAGLTWALVVRTNVQNGTSEIWRAFAASPLTNVTATATLSQSVSASLTVMSFIGVDLSGTNGSGAIGATASANAASGAPTATLVTTRDNSWVFGVGNDYDGAIARTPGAGQSIVHQYLPAIGDTYWVQKRNAPTPLAGTSVPINDTAPTTDRYNLSICEILPATTWSLSGTITPASIGGGVTVTLSGAASATVAADSNGNYSFNNLTNGTYSVTPTKSGYTFNPPSQSVSIADAPLAGINFTGQAVTGSVSGTITPVSAGSGALVTMSGFGSVSADSAGNYSFANVPYGTYDVSVWKTGYTFTPASQSVTVAGAVSAINFTGQAKTGPGAIAIDATIFKDLATASSTITTPAFSTTAGNELLLAFVSTDDSTSGASTQVNSMTGAGLTWALVVRTNVQRGTSEIWRAFAPAPLTNATVTATLSKSVSSSLTVMSFTGVDPSGTNGSGAIGATAGASAASGAPSATLVTTRDNSWVFGVGNDFDNPIARTAGAGQSMVHQYLAPIGDTYWVQEQNAPTPLAGTSITINDTAPTADRYNLSICEILPAPGVSTWSLSGTITPASIGSGATVTLSGAANATVTADTNGNYTFNNLTNGTYTATPTKSGYVFTPPNQTATINGASISGVNFTGAPMTWTVSGTITPASIGSGTTVTLSGVGSVIADSNGNYSFSSVANGSYTVTPSKAGYAFTPASAPVTVNGAPVSGVNFTGAPLTYSISGTISPASIGSGTTVTLSGVGSVTADSNGNYSFPSVANGSYTVTPSKAGYGFTPASAPVTVNGAPVSGVNFTGALLTYSLSGTISPASIGNGTTVTLSGAASATVTADSNGNYSFNNLTNGSYGISPSKSGYTFNPSSQSVSIADASVAAINFTGAPLTHSLSGTISPASLGSGATVTLPGTTLSTTADSSGRYSFGALPDGTYTVVPSKTGHTFAPLNQVVTVTGADVTGVDFTIQADSSWTIAGTITPASGGSSALVTLSGPTSGTTGADSNGNYSFTGLPNGSYTVTPTKSGYSFSPGNRSVTVSGASVSGIDFTAQPWTGSISGTITPASIGSGATVTLSGAASRTFTADSSGTYTFTGLADGTYTVTPTKNYSAFTPANRSVTVSGGAAVSGIDFTGAQQNYSISGTVSPPSDGAGTRFTLGESGDVVADGNGNYTFSGLSDGTYVMQPNKTGYTFTPPTQSVTINGASVTGINFTATAVGAAAVGQWSAPFDVGMVAVNMIMMHTGKVLMLAGTFAGSWEERVWDPATGNITLVPNPYYNLFCAGHSQLADGRILVVGGYDPPAWGAYNANIFDPATQTWSAVPNMTYRRWYPTSTTLPDGRALVMSGAQSCLTCLADVPEVFDPATNTFTTWPSARLAVPYYPFMFVLPDGKVVDAGANENAVATSKLDLTTRTWSTVDPVVRDGHSSAMYQPGKILKSGTAGDSGSAGNALPTAYVIDMNQPSPSWRQVASMANPRAFHNTTLLPDGNVLVTGGGTARDGYDVTKSVKVAELWSPTTETWKTLSSAAIPRLYHSTALLLPDGRVLTAGSGDDGPAVNQLQAEIFSPPYLFKGTRPAIASAPPEINYGSTFWVTSNDAGTIASVALIRPGAVTHAFDEDQRFLNLSFTHAPGALNVTAPANANLAPPGYYMLFIVNASGVPSVAAWVHFGTSAGDTEAPTAPSNLSGTGAVGSASLTWTASTDNTGVALYNVHRSTTSGFVPSPANRIGQPTTTSFTDSGRAAGTYFYVVTAQDVAGNVSQPSNEATVIVLSDTTPPTVAIGSPSQGATVTGTISVTATASDDVAVAGVQFQVDGQALGTEDTSPPYSVTWNSTTASNGPHTVTAVARDTTGNTAPASVDVTVSNTSQNPNGLVAAFGFNEGSGVQTSDASGQNNTGTISSATWTTTGKYGNALSFNGTSAWVTVADAASLDLTNGITIEAWVNPTSGTGWRSVVMKESTNGMAYTLYSANNASRPAAYVHTSSDQGLNGTSAVPINTWTHVAMTFDGATLRMFVNGAQVSSRALAGSAVVTTGALRIGGDAAWGEYFRGVIDEVRVYNRALTAAEIQSDMATPIP